MIDFLKNRQSDKSMAKNCPKKYWGGKRPCAGRKKTCSKKIPFNRRINEDILNILRQYAAIHNMNETEALENAILLQTNVYRLKGDKTMKIAIPTAGTKLCAHFGKCETFTFVDVDNETKEVLNVEAKAPDEGVSCQSAGWIASQGANIVIAGGMGGRPMMAFEEAGVKVITGCRELPIDEIVAKFLDNSLESGENACGGEHNHCHGHQHGEEGHHCRHHN